MLENKYLRSDNPLLFILKYPPTNLVLEELSRSQNIWKTYGYWAFWVGIVFFAVYPASNWLTSQRIHTFSLYTHSELDIPFLPGFVWAYLSMYILFLFPPFLLSVSGLNRLGKQLILATFLSGLIFLLLPTTLGFRRIVPENPFYRDLFANLFAIDLPHNMVPSLHVIFSAIILLMILDSSTTVFTKIVWWVWLVVLFASTLLVHQHHLLDVISGLGVALLCRYWVKEGGNRG